MNRDDFTKVLWKFSGEQDSRVWWERYLATSNWELTDKGNLFLRSCPEFSPNAKVWKVDCPRTARIVLMLGKLSFPWYQYTNIEIIKHIVFHSAEANTWMAICGADLERFLTTWTQ